VNLAINVGAKSRDPKNISGVVGHALARVGHSLARVKNWRHSTTQGPNYGLPNKLILWVKCTFQTMLLMGQTSTDFFRQTREKMLWKTYFSGFGYLSDCANV